MGFVKDTIDSITGRGQRDAAREASDAQVQATREAIDFSRESRDIARGDLAPFRGAGEGQINRLIELVNNPGDAIKNNQTFQVASEALGDDIAARNAARGKLGSGQTLNDIFRENALLGESLLQNDFNRNFNLVNLGNSAAAGQANVAQNTGNAVSNLLTQRGNAQAAGFIGAQNGVDQGTNNLIRLGTSIFSGGF